MNSIPLISNVPGVNFSMNKGNSFPEMQMRQEINTSLVALKKEAGTLEGLINEAAQMLNTINNRITVLENDTVKESDVVDTVSSGNMNPVTSNAVSSALNNPKTANFTNNVNATKIIHLGKFTLTYANRTRCNVCVEAVRADGSYRILASIMNGEIHIGIYDVYAETRLNILLYKTSDTEFDLYLYIGSYVRNVFVRLTEYEDFTYDGSEVSSYAGLRVLPVYSNSINSIVSGNTQPVTSGGVAEALANKQERYLFSRNGLNNKRYVLIGTADGSGAELASMSCDIAVTCRNYINASSFYYAKFAIHLDINFENLQSVLCVKGWTDCNLASSSNLNVGVVITKSGDTSYLYLDCTDTWFSATIIPLTAVTSSGRFVYQLPPTEAESLTGDVVYNSRADATKIAQVCWKELNINYTASSVSTSLTTILQNVPEFDEAIITTSNDNLVLKRDLDNNVSIATSYMHYTTGGDWDAAYDIRVEWDTHTMKFRQTIKGSQTNYTTVRKLFYR